jgi:hypothetical protein
VGARFSAPVQTGPGAHPASCRMGTVSFPGVKRPERAADHSPPSSAVVIVRVELYLYPPPGPHRPCNGVPFIFTAGAMIEKVYRSSCKGPLIVVRVRWKLNFLHSFSKNTETRNFMKIRPVGSRVVPLGRTDTTMLIVAFRNFANAPITVTTVHPVGC